MRPRPKKRTWLLCRNDAYVGFTEAGYHNLFTLSCNIQQRRITAQGTKGYPVFFMSDIMSDTNNALASASGPSSILR